MKFISPIPFTLSKLVSYQADGDAAPWSASTTYALGGVVSSGERLYKSIQGGNVGHSVTDDVWWVDAGPVNVMAMFDADPSTASVATSTDLMVEFLTSPTDVCDSVAVFGVAAQSVTVEVVADGVGTHTETRQLITADIGDWYDYFFSPDDRRTSAVFSLPVCAGEQVRVTFGRVAGEPTSCAMLVAGYTKTVGVTRLGGSRELVDYSRASADEFGAWSLTRRNYTSNGSYQCEVDREAANSVFADLAAVRGTPTLWFGVEDDDFNQIFGILGRVRGDLATKAKRYFTIEIKGMSV